MGADLRAAGDALVHVDREAHAALLGHRLAFQHHRPRDPALAVIGDQHVQRRRRQRADRIERHVAPELDPELVADLGTDGRLEAGGDQRLGQRRRARRLLAVRLAEGEAVAIGVLDDAGLGHLGGGIDDAADGALGRQQLADYTAGVHALHAPAFVGAGELMEIPPGDAVDRRDDGRLRPQQRLHLLRGTWQRMRLQRDDDVVLRPGLRGGGDGADGDHRLAALAAQREALGLHRLQVRAARDDGHLGVTLGGELRRHQPAERAGAEDAELHGQALTARCRASRPGRSASACPWRPSGSPAGRPPSAAP